jgi:hypothetical protein
LSWEYAFPLFRAPVLKHRLPFVTSYNFNELANASSC